MHRKGARGVVALGADTVEDPVEGMGLPAENAKTPIERYNDPTAKASTRASASVQPPIPHGRAASLRVPLRQRWRARAHGGPGCDDLRPLDDADEPIRNCALQTTYRTGAIWRSIPSPWAVAARRALAFGKLADENAGGV
ncbi:hypothetical protein B5F40_08240 [Gordonibacter sp. An230]|nr:hypothetical protein B5F40_08240 [Gordonibacter sp. An230]